MEGIVAAGAERERGGSDKTHLHSTSNQNQARIHRASSATYASHGNSGRFDTEKDVSKRQQVSTRLLSVQDRMYGSGSPSLSPVTSQQTSPSTSPAISPPHSPTHTIKNPWTLSSSSISTLPSSNPSLSYESSSVLPPPTSNSSPSLYKGQLHALYAAVADSCPSSTHALELYSQSDSLPFDLQSDIIRLKLLAWKFFACETAMVMPQGTYKGQPHNQNGPVAASLTMDGVRIHKIENLKCCCLRTATPSHLSASSPSSSQPSSAQSPSSTHSHHQHQQPSAPSPSHTQTPQSTCLILFYRSFLLCEGIADLNATSNLLTNLYKSGVSNASGSCFKLKHLYISVPVQV